MSSPPSFDTSPPRGHGLKSSLWKSSQPLDPVDGGTLGVFCKFSRGSKARYGDVGSESDRMRRCRAWRPTAEQDPQGRSRPRQSTGTTLSDPRLLHLFPPGPQIVACFENDSIMHDTDIIPCFPCVSMVFNASTTPVREFPYNSGQEA